MNQVNGQLDNRILLLSHHGTSILIEPPLNKPLAISTCNPWFPKPTLYSQRHKTLCSFNVPPLHSNTQWLKTEHQSVADPVADSESWSSTCLFLIGGWCWCWFWMREDGDAARAGAQREWMSWIMRVSNVPFGNYTSHSYIIKYFIYNIVPHRLEGLS